MANICKFVPNRTSYDQINTVNFVYETQIPTEKTLCAKPTYVLYLVTSGSGTLFSAQEEHPLQKGDLFFTFPSDPFAVWSEENDLCFLYISFLGLRAGKILEELGITQKNCVFSGYGFLEEFWYGSLNIATQYNVGMLSESVLLSTFSHLSRQLKCENASPEAENKILEIKQYIDEHYTDPMLSLDMLCSRYHYNKKYLSRLLKKTLAVGFSDYLRTLRVQHACALMNKGFSNVKDIAQLCGYRDPLYFSKLFKTILKQSPKEYMDSIRH